MEDGRGRVQLQAGVQSLNSKKDRNKAPQIPATKAGVPVVKSVSIAQSQVMSQQFQGPVPHPALLKAYGEVDISYPERIFAMAEKAAEHQQEIERSAMKQQEWDHAKIFSIQGRAQWFAATLAVVFAAVGVWFAILGHPGAGATIISSVVVGLAVAYLAGNASAGKKEENGKTK